MVIFLTVTLLANVFLLSALFLSILTDGFRVFLLQKKISIFMLVFATLFLNSYIVFFLPKMCATIIFLIIFLMILLSKKFWEFIRKNEVLTIVLSIFTLSMQLVNLYFFVNVFLSLLKML